MYLQIKTKTNSLFLIQRNVQRALYIFITSKRVYMLVIKVICFSLFQFLL